MDRLLGGRFEHRVERNREMKRRPLADPTFHMDRSAMTEVIEFAKALAAEAQRIGAARGYAFGFLK